MAVAPGLPEGARPSGDRGSSKRRRRARRPRCRRRRGSRTWTSDAGSPRRGKCPAHPAHRRRPDRACCPRRTRPTRVRGRRTGRGGPRRLAARGGRAAPRAGRPSPGHGRRPRPGSRRAPVAPRDTGEPGRAVARPAQPGRPGRLPGRGVVGDERPAFSTGATITRAPTTSGEQALPTRVNCPRSRLRRRVSRGGVPSAGRGRSGSPCRSRANTRPSAIAGVARGPTPAMVVS